MRILVVNQYFHPDLASTAQLLTELCEDLARQDDVRVVCGRPSYGLAGNPRPDSRPPPGVVVDRVRSTTFDRRSMAGRLTNYATFLLGATWTALRGPRPDVVLTMTDPPVVAAVAAMVAALRRAPYVYVCQDIFPDVALALGRMRPGLASKAFAWLNRALRRRAAIVVAIGRDMQERLVVLGTPPALITVIPNWADGAQIQPGRGTGFRREQGWEDRFVVMHSGNVGLSQGLDALLEAADLLRDDPSIIVAIIGDGASRHRLEKTVAARHLDNVRFLDYQPKECLADSLGAADVHVVALAAGLSGAIVPSKVYGIMAAGRPFVAAVEPGSEPARIIEEAGCGIRVDPGDVVALAGVIRDLRARPVEELDAMGNSGRQAFEASSDRSVATQAYRQVLHAASLGQR